MPISRRQSETRWSELRALLCEWDPIGVMGDPKVPRDEYDCLARPLLHLLEAGASEAEVVECLRNEITDHFGLSPKRYDFAAVSRRLRAWFVENWAEPKKTG